MKIVLDVRQQLVELCKRLGMDLRGCRLQPEFEEGFVEGLFVNVAEHAGEGKYRTVSDVWVKVKGRKGGMDQECAIWCMESLKKKGKSPIGTPFLILSPLTFYFHDAKMRL